MDDQRPDPGADARDEPELGSPPATPRWVKVFGIIALILIVLLAVMLLAGREHGPGLHRPSGDTGGQAPPDRGQLMLLRPSR